MPNKRIGSARYVQVGGRLVRITDGLNFLAIVTERFPITIQRIVLTSGTKTSPTAPTIDYQVETELENEAALFTWLSTTFKAHSTPDLLGSFNVSAREYSDTSEQLETVSRYANYDNPECYASVTVTYTDTEGREHNEEYESEYA